MSELERGTPRAFARIVSGGQTGVDRAALDAAAKHGIPAGGWCPHGRGAEDGPVGPRYALRETPSRAGEQRTRWNVRDSDATLVLSRGAPHGGTALALAEAGRLARPWLVVGLDADPEVEEVHAWANRHRTRVLNVAGPRESESPGVYALALAFLDRLLARTRVPAGRGRRALALLFAAWLAAGPLSCTPGESGESGSPAAVRRAVGDSTRRPERSAAVLVAGRRIPVDVARSDAEKMRGLSGRPSLAPDTGLLFLYEQPVIPAFWMKDMHFDIDIVWIRGGRIVDVTHDAPHQVDPPLPIYRPRAAVDAVLEVPAGTARRRGWGPGEPVGFELP